MPHGTRQNWDGGFFDLSVTANGRQARLEAHDEMLAVLVQNKVGSRMKQRLGASGAPDGSAEVTCAQEITGIALVGGIVERQSKLRAKMTFAKCARDGFEEDGLDGVGHEARLRRQDLPTDTRLTQRSTHNRPAGNSIENRHHVFEFYKVHHRDRHSFFNMSQNDYSRHGKVAQRGGPEPRRGGQAESEATCSPHEQAALQGCVGSVGPAVSPVW
jgi:hypothetical protein